MTATFRMQEHPLSARLNIDTFPFSQSIRPRHSSNRLLEDASGYIDHASLVAEVIEVCVDMWRRYVKGRMRA